MPLPLANCRRIALALATLTLSTAVLAQQQAQAPATDRLAEALDTISTQYWQPQSRTDLELRALRALVADLDPYGQVLDAAKWVDFKGGLAAQVAGVGVYLDLGASLPRPRIGRLLFESAAGAAGARPGDWIDRIGDTDTTGLAIDEALPLLRGAPGSVVQLTLRDNAGPSRVIAVTRKVHRVPSVHGVGRAPDGRADFMLDRERGIGYVRIAQMGEDSLADVRVALEDLRRARGCGLVLDLRGSSGGQMRASIEIADLFLARGLIAGTQERSGTVVSEADPAVDWAGPLVVLIDAATASTSEFLAAALRDNARGRFVGQRTYGKGRVQKMFPLASGGGLVLTTGRHVRPSGVAADRHDPPPANANAGVVPDTGLEMALAGDEHTRWREAMALRASPAIVPASELAPLASDRVLVRAVELLPATCPGPVGAR